MLGVPCTACPKGNSPEVGCLLGLTNFWVNLFSLNTHGTNGGPNDSRMFESPALDPAFFLSWDRTWVDPLWDRARTRLRCMYAFRVWLKARSVVLDPLLSQHRTSEVPKKQTTNLLAPCPSHRLPTLPGRRGLARIRTASRLHGPRPLRSRRTSKITRGWTPCERGHLAAGCATMPRRLSQLGVRGRKEGREGRKTHMLSGSEPGLAYRRARGASSTQNSWS